MTGGGVTLAAALALGLLGSVHCTAMCGGLAAAFALGIPHDAGPWARVRVLASLSAGRILGYGVAGAVVGTLGFAVAGLLGPAGAAALRALAGTALIAIAALVVGVGRTPAALERLGARVWRRLQPLTAGLRRDLGGVNALALGLLWGWLPCGLVYSALGFAATAGAPLPAMLVMMSFGLGTLPGVVLPSAAAFRLGRLVQARASRRVAAAMLFVFGLWTLAGAATMWSAVAGGGSCH